jgi:hypothetical protein
MNPQALAEHLTMLEYALYGLIAVGGLMVYLGNIYVTYLKYENSKLENKLLEMNKVFDDTIRAEHERLERIIAKQEISKLDRAINDIERNINGNNIFYKEEIDKSITQLQDLIAHLVKVVPNTHKPKSSS